jgi:hypothetical protein
MMASIFIPQKSDEAFRRVGLSKWRFSEIVPYFPANKKTFSGTIKANDVNKTVIKYFTLSLNRK